MEMFRISYLVYIDYRKCFFMAIFACIVILDGEKMKFSP